MKEREDLEEIERFETLQATKKALKKSKTKVTQAELDAHVAQEMSDRYFTRNLGLMVRLQARLRGFLERRRYLRYCEAIGEFEKELTHEDAIRVIRRAFRRKMRCGVCGVKARKVGAFLECEGCASHGYCTEEHRAVGASHHHKACHILSATMNKALAVTYEKVTTQLAAMVISVDNAKEYLQYIDDRVSRCRGCRSELKKSGKPLSICQSCHSAAYCGRLCQTMDWAVEHKVTCKARGDMLTNAKTLYERRRKADKLEVKKRRAAKAQQVAEEAEAEAETKRQQRAADEAVLAEAAEKLRAEATEAKRVEETGDTTQTSPAEAPAPAEAPVPDSGPAGDGEAATPNE
jgi:hypothetical protein